MSFVRFLRLVLIVGIFLAPITMSSGQAHEPAPRHQTSHCSQVEDGTGHRSPDKQARCMSACSAVEAECAQLATRLALRSAPVPIPTLSSLGGINPECDTPPPRQF